MPREQWKCRIHRKGRNLGEAVPYCAKCPVCVERRGHLPPEERDIPGVSYGEIARRWVGGLYHMDRRRL